MAKRSLTVGVPNVLISWEAWQKIQFLATAEPGGQDNEGEGWQAPLVVYSGKGYGQGNGGYGKKYSGGSRGVGELSAYMAAKQTSPGEFYVYDVVLVESENTAGSTTMNHEEDLAKLAAAGETDLLGDLKGWFHRHPGSKRPSWSGQDKKQMEEFGQLVPWLVSIVVANSNDREKYRCRVDLFEPYRLHFDDLEVEVEEHPEVKNILSSSRDEIFDTLQDEVDEKVKPSTNWGSKKGKKSKKDSPHSTTYTAKEIKERREAVSRMASLMLKADHEKLTDEETVELVELDARYGHTLDIDDDTKEWLDDKYEEACQILSEAEEHEEEDEKGA